MNTIYIVIAILPLLFASCSSGHRQGIIDNELWTSMRDGDTIDCYIMYKGHIYSNESTFQLEEREPLYPIDASTFMVCKGTGYAKDQFRVYYPLKPKYLRPAEDDLEKSVPYALQWVVESANPKNFAYLGEGYAVDGDKMYMNGEPTIWQESKYRKYVPRFSPESDSSAITKRDFSGDVGIWEALTDNEKRGPFIIINGNIYVLDVKTGISDIANEVPEFDYLKFINGCSDNSIKCQAKLKNADLETFKVCKGTGYAKDKNNIYHPNKWVALICPEYKDLRFYVPKEIVIKEADVSSFRYIGDGLAIDNNNMYFDGNKIDTDTLIVNTAMRLHSTNSLFKWSFGWSIRQ